MDCLRCTLKASAAQGTGKFSQLARPSDRDDTARPAVDVLARLVDHLWTRNPATGAEPAGGGEAGEWGDARSPNVASYVTFWGSRGRRFKSCRPDGIWQARRGFRSHPEPLLDLREPNGEPTDVQSARWRLATGVVCLRPGPFLYAVSGSGIHRVDLAV